MKTINKVLSLTVITAMAFSMSSCSLFGASGNDEEIITAAEDFSKTLVSRKASKIAKLCDDVESEDIAEFFTIPEGNNGTVIDYVADTVQYKVDEKSAEIKKDKATVEVTFTMVDYEEVTETDSIYNSPEAVIEILKKADEKEVTTTIELKKSDDAWLVTNLDDLEDDVYSFYKMSLVFASSTEPSETTDVTDSTEPTNSTDATEPSETSSNGTEDPDFTDPSDDSNRFWTDDGVFLSWIDNTWCKKNVQERDANDKFAYGWYISDVKDINNDGYFSTSDTIRFVLPLKSGADTKTELTYGFYFAGNRGDALSEDSKPIESGKVTPVQIDGVYYYLFEMKTPPTKTGNYELAVEIGDGWEHPIFLTMCLVK